MEYGYLAPLLIPLVRRLLHWFAWMARCQSAGRCTPRLAVPDFILAVATVLDLCEPLSGDIIHIEYTNSTF